MRILFIGMSNSIHVSRWIKQLQETGWDIHFFPVEDIFIEPTFGHLTIHDSVFHLKKKTLQELNPSIRFEGIYWNWLKHVWYLPKSSLIIRRVMSRVKRSWPNRAWRLAETIRRIKPDIVHSLEIQHAGYLTNYAKTFYRGSFPPWIVSNWGSDIYLFGRLCEHVGQIKAVLTACDYYLCECNRDIELGRQYGFEKQILPVLPVAGGHDLKHMRQFRDPAPTSSKRLIMLKGYQGWAGRAFVGLRAIELCADLLKDYRVAIYLSSPDVKLAADLMSHKTGIPVNIIPYGAHEDILRLHGRARISIGLSISDAISTSLLEAMIMGSFPIQSDTGCGNEWLEDGKTGILVPPEDPEKIAEAIRRAVTDDELVDRATEMNDRMLDERLDEAIIRPQVIAMYEGIMADRTK